jgi:hypothetical protein
MATRGTSARPVGLRLAAAAQAAEAVAMGAVAVFAVVVTADGHNLQLGNEIGLTLLAFLTAAGLAAFAVGLYRGRPWSRTPVVLTQLFVGGYGLYLVAHHRIGWGLPALLVAVGCLAGLFTPASLQALNRPAPPEPADDQPAKIQPAKIQPAKSRPASNQPAKSRPASNQPAKSRPASNQPAKSRLASNQPAKSRSANSLPADGQPAKIQSAKSRPASNQPAKRQPAKKAAR